MITASLAAHVRQGITRIGYENISNLNVMLVEMVNVISEKYSYKCVDGSRYNGIKGAMTICTH